MVGEVFALQERLAREIVGALRVTLTPEEETQLAPPGADDFLDFEGQREATLDRLDDYLRHLQAYQKVRQEIYRFTDTSVNQAVRLPPRGNATPRARQPLL